MSRSETKKFAGIRQDVEQYYTRRLQEHGATARGVDWNSQESQELRFIQILKVCQAEEFSLNELGCGFGSLASFIERLGYKCQYAGYDVATNMIDKAKQIHGERNKWCFEVGSEPLANADYTVCSGIFNVRFSYSDEVWRQYMVSTLDVMHRTSIKGFAFNVLTSYSDPDKRRSDLYYADPCWFFDYCKRTYSKNVALLHDYGLFEFTMLIRK